MKEKEEKIIGIINLLSPYLINHGGYVEFVKYEDDVVYVRMSGACANCQMVDFTLKEGIEAAIKEEVPSVKEVVSVC